MPIGDRTVLAHVAARLAAAGITEAVLNTHHLAAAFAGLAGLPLALRVILETEILGTAGGVAHAAALLGEGDVLVWNGDILAAVDVGALIASPRTGGAAATLAVAPRAVGAVGDGTVGLGADGRVVRLRGERFGDEIAGADFLGVHVLGAALRARLPERGCLVGDLYLPALREGKRLATLSVPGPWDDIGTVEAYLTANARWLGRAGLAAHVGEGARVDPGIDLTGSVVGAGAVVRGAGALTRSVIWPGARAEAPLDRAVVTPRGVVRGAPT